LLILEGRKHYIVAVIVLVVSTVSLIYGSRYLFKRTSPSLAKSIQYQYALQNSSGHALKAVRFYAFVPIKQTSFQRCQNIQASHPYEIQTAQNLKAHKPIKTVENIFNWVAAHITYAGYTKNAHGALYAHLYQKRDCTEYMHLFIALCRANQIPARGIAGYVVTTNRKVKPSEYHNWAEFFDGKRWQIADPQKKIFMQDEQNYIAMRILHTTPTAPIEPFKRFKVDPKGVKVKMI
jgi:hemolysin-activating ACP:hemolysin acyltransferase